MPIHLPRNQSVGEGETKEEKIWKRDRSWAENGTYHETGWRQVQGWRCTVAIEPLTYWWELCGFAGTCRKVDKACRGLAVVKLKPAVRPSRLAKSPSMLIYYSVDCLPQQDTSVKLGRCQQLLFETDQPNATRHTIDGQPISQNGLLPVGRRHAIRS